MDQLRANCFVDRGAAEQARLEAIDQLDILDTPREEPFDRLSRLICNIFDVPMAIVSIIDGHRQWYKAFDGIAASEVERQDSFCNLLVEDPRPLIVPDATQDVRFAQKPAVLGPPKVRFYAGVPLTTTDGHVIGTICALDTRPRAFDDRQVEILSDIAHLTMQAIKLSRFATTDSLTGLMSRRAFKDAGDKAMAQAARHGQPLSCITFDIDHFKAINDT